jgi:hypothetical protein
MTANIASPSRLELLARERPVVDMLRSVLKVPDPQTQSVLDAFVDAYAGMTRGEPFTEAGYQAMRQICSATRGWVDQIVEAKICEIFPPPPPADFASPLLGDLTAAGIEEVGQSLDRDGVHLFDRPMPAEWLRRLTELVERTPLRDQYGGDWTSLAAADKTRARYMADERGLYADDAPWHVVADPALLAIVGRYLHCQPVMDSIYAYATFPGASDQEEMSRSAQLFHADKDRISFIKFFVYLSDVDNESGPHVYIAGSHRTKPDTLWRDGRFSDEEVVSAYPAGAVRKIIGPAGTMFLADTRGIHKGLPVKRGRRLMFQIEYSNSCAGKHYPMAFRRAENGLVETLGRTYPRLVMRFD